MVDQKDQISVGNESHDNIETAKFEGYDILLRQGDDGQYEIDPQDAPQEVIEKLNNGEAPKLIAALNKKNLTTNKDRQELDLLKKEYELKLKELELKGKAYETQQPTQPIRTKTEDDYLVEVFGTSDSDQLALMQADNPKAFILKQAKVAQLMSGAVSYADLQQIQMQSQIDSQIISQGYDPRDIESFMRESSMTDKNKAFELYRKLNQKAQAETPANMRANVQDISPKVLTPGSIRPTATPNKKIQDYYLELAKKA